MTGEQVKWPLLVNAALGNFLAGTSSRIFAVSLPTVANSLETTIVGISWAVIAYQISQIPKETCLEFYVIWSFEFVSNFGFRASNFKYL